MHQNEARSSDNGPSMQNRFSTSLVPLLAVLGSVTALGLGTSLAKSLFPAIGASGTTALRVGFSALITLLLWRPWRHGALTRQDWMALLRYGVPLGGMNLLFYQSLKTIPFGLAVAIEFSGPLAVAMWHSRRPIDFVWLAFALTGLGLLLPVGANAAQALHPEGVAYALAAAVSWGAYIVYGKRLSHWPTRQSVPLGLGVAALTVLPFGLVEAGSSLLQPGVLLTGLVVALVSSTIPISLEMVALKRLPSGTFGILLSTEPAVAALLGLLLLNEHLTVLQWAAIACTMAAAVGSAGTARRG